MLTRKAVLGFLGGFGAVVLLSGLSVLSVLALRSLPPTGPVVETPVPLLVVHAPYGVRSNDEPPGRGVVFMAYADPFGSSAPGGAPSLDTSPPGVAGAGVGSALDGLSDVPFALLAPLMGVGVLWWAIRFVIGLFQS
jgi:hypothetical protein